MEEPLKNFFSSKLSLYTTIILIVIYNIFLDRDLTCTCKPQSIWCSLYMALPFFSILFLTLWLDKKFLKTWKHTCTCRSTQLRAECQRCCCSPFLWGLLRHIIKAASVGALWVSSVLIDGDWYVCCQNDQSEQQAQLACKTHITAEDQTIIAGLKNRSKIIGFSVLLGIIFLVVLMSLFEWRKCCGRNSGCCDRKAPYQKLILEEEKNVWKEILRTTAKQKLTEEVRNTIRSEEWWQCFDVAEGLMGQPPVEADNRGRRRNSM